MTKIQETKLIYSKILKNIFFRMKFLSGLINYFKRNLKIYVAILFLCILEKFSIFLIKQFKY